MRQLAEEKADHRLRVYSDITQLIASPENPTPLVRLNRVNPNEAFPVYLKLERYNPFGSVKDRIVNRISHFFAGYGTCGTICGVGRYLKGRDPGVRVIGVEPASPEHKLPGLKRITGLSEELMPKILDRGVIDETVAVTDEEAYAAAVRLARQERVLVGPTTGAALHVALGIARSGSGLVVVISPDDALKYASSYQEFLSSELTGNERELSG